MITASIVLFKNEEKQVLKAIRSILSTKTDIRLILVDNSPTNVLSILKTESPLIIYIYNDANLGFGAGHNIAFKKAEELNSRYHVVVNPDIEFFDDVLKISQNYFDENPDVVLLMPKVLNRDLSIQFLPKLLPSPSMILIRSVRFLSNFFENKVADYELRSLSLEIPSQIPLVSGCFSFFRTKTILEVGGYDERFFMYFEDWDLSRRIAQAGKVIYFPSIQVIHGYENGAKKSLRLFKIFLTSLVKYFNKWGWFCDKDRRQTNQRIIKKYR